MSLPTAGESSVATFQAPGADVLSFSPIIDLSRLDATTKADINTADRMRFRVARNDTKTEQFFDPLDFNGSGDPGWMRFFYGDALALDPASAREIVIYAANTRNTAYADSFAYNAYDSAWLSYHPLQADFNDRTVNDYDGTSTTPPTAGDIAGHFGQGTNFNGRDNYLEIMSTAEDPLSGSDEIMISAWCKPTSLTADQRVVTRWSATTQYMLWMDTGGSDGWAGILSLSGGIIRAGEAESTATTNWQNVVMTYNSSDLLRMYTNASPGATASANGTLNANADTATYIGRLTATYYAGGLQDVQIHSLQRSASFISEEYDQTNDNSTFWGTWTNVPVGPSTGIAILRRRMEDAA